MQSFSCFSAQRSAPGGRPAPCRVERTAGTHRHIRGIPAKSSPEGAAVAPVATADVAPPPDEPAIMLTEKARSHLRKLKAEMGGGDLFLRVGVRQGGCSGLSYDMKYIQSSEIASDDYSVAYDDQLRMVCDPKSLLYLFGMELDFSDELIGGGFKFNNPNAVDSCGCGKSFGV